MVKKALSFILALLLMLIPYTAFADDSTVHTHDFSGNSISFGITVDDLAVQVTETACINADCTYVKYDADFLVFHFSYVADKHLSADEVYKRFMAWRLNQIGANSNLEKLDSTNAGANIPAPGGRNPKGYEDEGKPNVTSSGASCIWVEPFGISSYYYGFHQNAPSSCVTGSSQSGTYCSLSSSITPQYYFTAPVSGLYFVGSYGSPYDFGTFSYFTDKWKLKYLTANFTNPYQYSISLKKGETCYFGFNFNDKSYDPSSKPYKFSLNRIPIYIEPLGDSSITTTNNITINNNTWNGNIYTDNSTNLTYIYPQYTTVNEKNETVTNISNTPIIYNNETKQYYTYDQTTKNYYYITYNSDPAPSPTPTPAPTDKPGGSIPTPETGKPGGSSGSGQSWWDKLLDKIGDAIIDGLLGAVSAVLKLIFKLLSTILGWIIWAVSLVFSLFPFLPPGLSGLLVGGVVVCFVIGIIKFIRG